MENKSETAVRLINQKKLNGIIVYSNGSSNILRPSYFQYFAGFKPNGNAALIISKTGKLAIIVESDTGIYFSAKSSKQHFRITHNISSRISKTLKEFEISGNVGIIGGDQVTVQVYENIAKGIVLQPADDIIETIAQEKNEFELTLARKAANIADIGFEAFLKGVRIGIKEYELVADTVYAMRAAGADDIFILISSEKHNYALHRPLDKTLSSGDIVIVEMAPFCEGQCVQVCRTICLGKPNAILEEKYDLLVRAFNASLEKIKPGSPAYVISREMNRIITEAGYGEYCHPPHMRARGHGFGVGSISPGAVIDDDTDVILTKDRVLISHPNQYFPETGYLACGETILVNDTGFERLLHSDTKLYIKEV